MQLLVLAVFGAVVIAAIVFLARMNEVFCVSIREGRCIVVRGSVSPALWSELQTVVRMNRVQRGTVRAVKDGGRLRLVVDGIDEGTAQRLRNAFGTRGFSQARTGEGSASQSKNLGQLLGIAWLAWLLSGR
jgi:hypothetical protein